MMADMAALPACQWTMRLFEHGPTRASMGPDVPDAVQRERAPTGFANLRVCGAREWCTADPGPRCPCAGSNRGPGSAAHHFARRALSAALRPGHEALHVRQQPVADIVDAELAVVDLAVL